MGFVCVAAFALGGCVTNSSGTVAANAPDGVTQAVAAPSTGAWKFDRSDRIKGAAATKAWMLSSKASGRPGRITRPAGLQLLCFKDTPVVQIKFMYRIGSNTSAALAYRFDERPSVDATARFLQDFQTIVIQDQTAVAQFIDELRTSGKLFVRVNSLIVGQTSAEFQVHDSDAAIDAAFADCPLPTKKLRRAG